MNIQAERLQNRDTDSAGRVRLVRGKDRRVRVGSDGTGTAIHVRRCFPWEQPMKYLSLCDADGNEVALIEDLAELDPESRAVLEEELAVVGFTLIISRIVSVEKEIEIRNWNVEIEGEERTFQTELDEWPRRLNDGTVLIRDVAGDLYTLPHPDELDRGSRDQIFALLE